MRWRTSSTSEPDVDLAGILVGLDAIVWQADPDERRLTYVNDACLALSGRDAGAWLSAPDFGAAFIDAADRERVVEAIGRAPASGERQELEYRLVAPDGGVAWIMNAFRAVPGAQGRRSMRGVMVDLTSRKNAEQALLQQLSRSEEEYRSLFDVHPNPVWVYDLETLRFLAVNEATVRKYGWSRQELASMTIAEIRPPEDVASLTAAVRNVSEGFTHSGPWHHQKRDGTVFEVEISSHTTTFGGAGRRS